METTTKPSMHPLTAIAAVAVTLFSLAGIGAITGLIPTSHSQSAQAQQTNTAEAPVKPAAVVTPAETTAAATAPSTPKPAVRKVAAARPRKVEHAALPAPEPIREVRTDAPVIVAQNTLPPMNAPVAAPAKPLCYDCGVIESVREVEKKGEGSGTGAIVGGIAGGVLGHQTGGGRGRDVMTVLGAIGGAVAGNAVEKNVKKVKSYEINIRFEDGSSRVIAQDTPPAWRSGDKVRLVNGVISANNS